MDEVSVLINENVAIVSVFDLEDEGDDSVGGKRSDKVVASKLKLRGRLSSVSFEEVLMQVDFECFSELVSRVRIGHDFNYTSKLIFRASSV